MVTGFRRCLEKIGVQWADFAIETKTFSRKLEPSIHNVRDRTTSAHSHTELRVIIFPAVHLPDKGHDFGRRVWSLGR